MARSRIKIKGRSTSGSYLSLPHAVLDSDSYRQLRGAATKLLIMIASQYRGSNNGDLCAPFSYVKNWGIGSEATLSKAIKELMEANLIVRTRQPTRDRKNPHGQCSLYAVTWQPIDECKGKIDIEASAAPPRNFSRGLARV